MDREGSPMKALSFLGAGRYQEVTYVWSEGQEGERSHTTRLLPEALMRIFDPEKIVIFVTETKNSRPSQSEPRYVETLQERLGDQVEWVDIPEGRSEQELWEIFDKVASAVNHGDRVLLDITHAFRSIPMIVFAATACLRRMKNVTIERIVYDALGARQGDVAPIPDLTSLLDQISGTEALLKRDEAQLMDEKKNCRFPTWKCPAVSGQNRSGRWSCRTTYGRAVPNREGLLQSCRL